MTPPRRTDPPNEPAVRVSTLELFFDLVFVSTITQLTAVFAGDLTGRGLLRIALMLGVIWWMYGGYAWLTNAVAPVNPYRRGFMVIGMAGFLTIALAIPHAFGSAGWAFGIGYFVVNLVHSGLFRLAGGPGAVRAIVRLAPLNLTSASLVLIGGFLPGLGRYLAWAAALAVQIVSPYLHPIGEFDLSAAHFVERHGLVVIIALGESVVAIGAGSHGVVSGRVIVAAVLSLTLVYYLWWAYFGGDDDRAERALDGIADRRTRSRAALASYGYAHYPILLGIVVLAAGVKLMIGHGFGGLHFGPALAVGGGVALFLAGDLVFRGVLRLGAPWFRLVAVAVAGASVPLGMVWATGQLVLITLALMAMLTAEDLLGRRRGADLVEPAR